MPGRIPSKLADIFEKKIMVVDYPLKNGAIGSTAQDNPSVTDYRHCGRLLDFFKQIWYAINFV
jgi:hypothetical protein